VVDSAGRLTGELEMALGESGKESEARSQESGGFWAGWIGPIGCIEPIGLMDRRTLRAMGGICLREFKKMRYLEAGSGFWGGAFENPQDAKRYGCACWWIGRLRLMQARAT